MDLYKRMFPITTYVLWFYDLMVNTLKVLILCISHYSNVIIYSNCNCHIFGLCKVNPVKKIIHNNPSIKYVSDRAQRNHCTCDTYAVS